MQPAASRTRVVMLNLPMFPNFDPTVLAGRDQKRMEFTFDATASGFGRIVASAAQNGGRAGRARMDRDNVGMKSTLMDERGTPIARSVALRALTIDCGPET